MGIFSGLVRGAPSDGADAEPAGDPYRRSVETLAGGPPPTVPLIPTTVDAMDQDVRTPTDAMRDARRTTGTTTTPLGPRPHASCPRSSPPSSRVSWNGRIGSSSSLRRRPRRHVLRQQRHEVIGVDASHTAIEAAGACRDPRRAPRWSRGHRGARPRQRIRGDGGPRVVYARFFVHAITEAEEEGLLDVAAAMTDPGDLLAVEYRTVRDSSGAKVTKTHYRRFVLPAAFEARALGRGFDVIYSDEGSGFAEYRMNANIAGTLYQDAHSTPGATMTAPPAHPLEGHGPHAQVEALIRLAAERFVDLGYLGPDGLLDLPMDGGRAVGLRIGTAGRPGPPGAIDRHRRRRRARCLRGRRGPGEQLARRSAGGVRAGQALRHRPSDRHADPHRGRPARLGRDPLLPAPGGHAITLRTYRTRRRAERKASRSR